MLCACFTYPGTTTEEHLQGDIAFAFRQCKYGNFEKFFSFSVEILGSHASPSHDV